MRFNRRGITLVECLISIILIGTLLGCILGAFFISRSAASKTEHRLVAIALLREFMEFETRCGFDGYTVRDEGEQVIAQYADGNNDGYFYDDYYNYIKSYNEARGHTFPSAITPGEWVGPITIGDLQLKVKPEPYIPSGGETFGAPKVTVGTAPQICEYKIVGFVVSWDEVSPGSVSGVRTLEERAAGYIADHNAPK